MITSESGTLELLLQLFFAERDADGPSVGAVFQIFSCHDLSDQCQQFSFIIFPACLDGGFAGDGVEDLIPDGGVFLTAAGQEICCNFFHSLGSLFCG